MTASDYLTLAALIIVPISAVLLGQYLQIRSKKREEIRKLRESKKPLMLDE
ncbi:MAG: hypothetical protein FWG90_02695 [Oscillospiraceae bacterium]|nr:hypothetical protein [Oscillospiraceae bacterium]